MEIPIRSAALSSTTYIPFFEYLGARETIFYVKTKPSALSSCLLKLVEQNLTEVINPGDETSGVDLDDAVKFNASAYARTGGNWFLMESTQRN